MTHNKSGSPYHTVETILYQADSAENINSDRPHLELDPQTFISAKTDKTYNVDSKDKYFGLKFDIYNACKKKEYFRDWSPVELGLEDYVKLLENDLPPMFHTKNKRDILNKGGYMRFYG
jgi:hypothetical protein